ncbi:putative cytochrome P450 [Helianthus debilis subsp. tardiflorus]
MFNRAIGFAPNGTYWRLLRRIGSSHLFAPRHVFTHEHARVEECTSMLNNIVKEQSLHGFVVLRKHLQIASLNNIMEIVFGKSYNKNGDVHEYMELQKMVREGFELLGAFNWSDHLSWLNNFYDPSCVKERCVALVPRVQKFVKKIIDEHKLIGSGNRGEDYDFVDILLSLSGEEKLSEDDMVAILWVSVILPFYICYLDLFFIAHLTPLNEMWRSLTRMTGGRKRIYLKISIEPGGRKRIYPKISIRKLHI